MNFPGLHEITTAFLVAGKCSVGTVLLPFSKTASEQCFDGAKNDMDQYCNTSVIVGGGRALCQAVNGDSVSARATASNVGTTFSESCNKVPLLGHAKGFAHLAFGDEESFEKCMKDATRTTMVVATAGMTGGGSLVAAGVVGATTGLAYDGAVSKVTNKKYGLMKAVEKCKTDASGGVDLIVGVGIDFATGAATACVQNDKDVDESALTTVEAKSSTIQNIGIIGDGISTLASVASTLKLESGNCQQHAPGQHQLNYHQNPTDMQANSKCTSTRSLTAGITQDSHEEKPTETQANSKCTSTRSSTDGITQDSHEEKPTETKANSKCTFTRSSTGGITQDSHEETPTETQEDQECTSTRSSTPTLTADGYEEEPTDVKDHESTSTRLSTPKLTDGSYEQQPTGLKEDQECTSARSSTPELTHYSYEEEPTDIEKDQPCTSTRSSTPELTRDNDEEEPSDIKEEHKSTSTRPSTLELTDGSYEEEPTDIKEDHESTSKRSSTPELTDSSYEKESTDIKEDQDCTSTRSSTPEITDGSDVEEPTDIKEDQECTSTLSSTPEITQNSNEEELACIVAGLECTSTLSSTPELTHGSYEEESTAIKEDQECTSTRSSTPELTDSSYEKESTDIKEDQDCTSTLSSTPEITDGSDGEEPTDIKEDQECTSTRSSTPELTDDDDENEQTDIPANHEYAYTRSSTPELTDDNDEKEPTDIPANPECTSTLSSTPELTDYGDNHTTTADTPSDLEDLLTRSSTLERKTNSDDQKQIDTHAAHDDPIHNLKRRKQPKQTPTMMVKLKEIQISDVQTPTDTQGKPVQVLRTTRHKNPPVSGNEKSIETHLGIESIPRMPSTPRQNLGKRDSKATNSQSDTVATMSTPPILKPRQLCNDRKVATYAQAHLDSLATKLFERLDLTTVIDWKLFKTQTNLWPLSRKLPIPTPNAVSSDKKANKMQNDPNAIPQNSRTPKPTPISYHQKALHAKADTETIARRSPNTTPGRVTVGQKATNTQARQTPASIPSKFLFKLGKHEILHEDSTAQKLDDAPDMVLNDKLTHLRPKPSTRCKPATSKSASTLDSKTRKRASTSDSKTPKRAANKTSPKTASATKSKNASSIKVPRCIPKSKSSGRTAEFQWFFSIWEKVSKALGIIRSKLEWMIKEAIKLLKQTFQNFTSALKRKPLQKYAAGQLVPKISAASNQSKVYVEIMAVHPLRQESSCFPFASIAKEIFRWDNEGNKMTTALDKSSKATTVSTGLHNMFKSIIRQFSKARKSRSIPKLITCGHSLLVLMGLPDFTQKPGIRIPELDACMELYDHIREMMNTTKSKSKLQYIEDFAIVLDKIGTICNSTPVSLAAILIHFCVAFLEMLQDIRNWK